MAAPATLATLMPEVPQVAQNFCTEIVMFFVFCLGYLVFSYELLGKRRGAKSGGNDPKAAKPSNRAHRAKADRLAQHVEAGEWNAAVTAFAELQQVEVSQLKLVTRSCISAGRQREAARLVQQGLDRLVGGPLPATHGAAVLEVAALGNSTTFTDVWAALRDFGMEEDERTWQVILSAHASHASLAEAAKKVLQQALASGKCSKGAAHSALVQGALARGNVDGALDFAEAMCQAGVSEELAPAIAVSLCRTACGRPGGAAQALGFLEGLGEAMPVEAMGVVIDFATQQKDINALHLIRWWPRGLAQATQGHLLRAFAATCDPEAAALFDERVKVDPHLADGQLAGLVACCAERRNVAFADHVMQWAAGSGCCSAALFMAGIKVYSCAQQPQRVCDMYEQVRAAGVEPDDKMYTGFIRAAVACGRFDFARELFRLCSEPEVQNYMALMRACASERDLPAALAVLKELEESKLCADTSACNCALHACVTCEDIDEARRLFSRMSVQGKIDVVSFNTLLKGLSGAKCWQEVHIRMTEMRTRGFEPNCVTYNSLINAAVHEENMSLVWRLVDDMAEQRVPVDEYTCSILTKVVRLTSKREDVDRALNLIDCVSGAALDGVFFSTLLDSCIRLKDHARLRRVLQMLQRSRITWSPHTCNVLIRAYGFAQHLDRAWKVWYDMSNRWHLERNDATYAAMLEACVQCGAMDDAVGVFREMCQQMPERAQSSSTHAVLIKGFAQRKEMHRALQVYDEMKQLGVCATLVIFNTLIDACARVGDMDRATSLFREMALSGVDPDLITYSTAIKGYCLQGDLEQALALSGTMQRKGIKPDAILFNSILDGCAKRQMRTLTESVLADMEGLGIAPSNITLSILVKLYGRCRDLNRAFEVVDEIPRKYGLKVNAHVYTCLMTACISNGGSEGLPKAFRVFEEMQGSGCPPDAKTYETLVNGCLKQSDVHRAVEVVEAALRDYTRDCPFPLDAGILGNLMFMIGRQNLTEQLGKPLAQRLRSKGVNVENRV